MRILFVILALLGITACNRNKFPYDADFSMLIAHSNSKIEKEILGISIYLTVKKPHDVLSERDLGEIKAIKEIRNKEEILKVLSVVRNTPKGMEVVEPAGKFGKVYHLVFKAKGKNGYLKIYDVEGSGQRLGLVQTWNGSGAYYGNNDLLDYLEKYE